MAHKAKPLEYTEEKAENVETLQLFPLFGRRPRRSVAPPHSPQSWSCFLKLLNSLSPTLTSRPLPSHLLHPQRPRGVCLVDGMGLVV